MIETTDDDRRFPPALADMARVEFYCDDDHQDEHDDDAWLDYEPYGAFDSAEETTHWIRQWTGNHELDGDAYRVFGQDGTGGLAALWCVRPGRPLTEQPVVFLGSEGERGVLAANLSDFLWLLADGLGPREVVEYGPAEAHPNPPLTELAERHATTPRRAARDIVTEAQSEFATFSEDLDKLCR